MADNNFNIQPTLSNNLQSLCCVAFNATGAANRCNLLLERQKRRPTFATELAIFTPEQRELLQEVLWEHILERGQRLFQIRNICWMYDIINHISFI